MDLPKLYQFEDYREFLKAYADHRKETSEYFSVRGWARRLEMKSSSTLMMILNRKRHAGPKLIPVFSNYFKFNKKEHDYFEDLVQTNKNMEKQSAMTVFLNPLLGQSQKGNRPLFSVIEVHAIRELALMKDFVPNGSWIVKKIKTKLTASELTSILEKMKDEGLLSEDYAPTNRLITPSHEVTKQDMHKFHYSLMELSSQSVNDDVEKRSLQSTTLSIKKERVEDAKKMLRDFQKEFCNVIEEQPGEDVYQLNIQFFSLLK